MITNFNLFENIRSEFPDMFSSEKSPQIVPVPGFENLIDPEDDEKWGEEQNESDKEAYYNKFLPLVKKRNIKETKDEIIINIADLWNDFYMTIYEEVNYGGHFKEFTRKLLIGKYISKGYKDLMTEEQYEGVITQIGYLFQEPHECYIDFQLKGRNIKYGFVEDIIVIDKLKTTASQYNL
jgi:hypothetical protein